MSIALDTDRTVNFEGGISMKSLWVAIGACLVLSACGTVQLEAGSPDDQVSGPLEVRALAASNSDLSAENIGELDEPSSERKWNCKVSSSWFSGDCEAYCRSGNSQIYCWGEDRCSAFGGFVACDGNVYSY